MTKPSIYLTRTAARMLRDIYARSEEQWGAARADRYMEDLYAVMQKIALKPDLGKLRKPRCGAFMMLAAGKHFIVYDCLEKRIVILAFLHQRRDIETLIAKMEPSFWAEIERMRSGLKSETPS